MNRSNLAFIYVIRYYCVFNLFDLGLPFSRYFIIIFFYYRCLWRGSLHIFNFFYIIYYYSTDCSDRVSGGVSGFLPILL